MVEEGGSGGYSRVEGPQTTLRRSPPCPRDRYIFLWTLVQFPTREERGDARFSGNNLGPVRCQA